MQDKLKIDFNINQMVLVKLTPAGKFQLCKDHYEFWLNSNPWFMREFKLPKEDSNGYSKWQLWHLMEALGKYCGLCKEPPFETDIILLKD